MFIDNARREPTTLLSTVRSTAFGMKKLTVNVVNGAPLGGDEAYVEVYVATNRTTPVVQFLSKALIRIGTATVADVVGQALRHPRAAALGLDTSDARLCRARLMPPMRSSALGVPMLKPKIKDNMTSHSIDELRIVLQPLDVPEASPLTKSSLILTLHAWDSRNPDPATALGPRREIVTAKDAPVKDLVLAACRLLDVDPPKAALLPTLADDGKKADKDTPKVEEPQPEASDVAPPIEFAKARTYLQAPWRFPAPLRAGRYHRRSSPDGPVGRRDLAAVRVSRRRLHCCHEEEDQGSEGSDVSERKRRRYQQV
jgi:hypothetical protein